MLISGSALPKEFTGKTDKRLVELVDIYPTILKSIGINTPDALPGINLLSTEIRDANFCALHERKKEASFMWRTEEYKLILRMSRKTNANEYNEADILGGEFYNLEKDPQEWNNLFGIESVRLQQNKMLNDLIDHLKKLGRLNPNSIHFENPDHLKL